MTTPTYPDMWADLLTQLNALLNWDIIRGPMILVIGMTITVTALAMLARVWHK